MAAVSINYPTARTTNDTEAAINEWHRILGFLDYDEALARLDLYMEDPNNTKPPRPHDLKRVQTASRSGEYFQANTEHAWHVENGRLFDEEDREYVHDPLYEDGYHYNAAGDICIADGRTFKSLFDTESYIMRQNQRFKAQVIGLLATGQKEATQIAELLHCHKLYPVLVRNRCAKEVIKAMEEQADAKPIQQQV